VVTFITSPWTNGKPNSETGSGFGLRIPSKIRRDIFQKEWETITICTESIEFVVPVTPAFWRQCNEIRSRHIGEWLIDNGLDKWPKGTPPLIYVTHLGGTKFYISAEDVK